MAIGTPYSAATTVQSTTGTTAQTITTNATVPLGDTLFIIYEQRLNATNSITSVTNNGGLSLSPDIYANIQAGTQNGNTWIIRIYASSAIPSGTQFTINLSASASRHCVDAFGVGGVADAVADANHIGTGGATGAQLSVSTAGSTPAAGDLAISQIAHVGAGAQNDTGTATSGFTEYSDTYVTSVSPFLHGYVEYRILSSGGTVTSSPTFASDTGGIVGQVVVFQPAATTVPDPVRPMPLVRVGKLGLRRLPVHPVFPDSTALPRDPVPATPLPSQPLLIRLAHTRGMPPILPRRPLDNQSLAVVTVTSGVLDVTGTGTITAAGASAVSGTLDATGVGTITVAASNATSFSGSLDATGTGTITVLGSFNIAPQDRVQTQPLVKLGPTLGRGPNLNRFIPVQPTVTSGPLEVHAGQRCTLGYSNQVLGTTDVAEMEKLLGRKFSGLRQNQDISTTTWGTANTEFDNGRTVTYRSIQISTGTWQDVTNGVHDADLTSTATTLMAAGRWSPTNPAIICFHHETSLTSNDVFGTSQDYIDAYRHVRDLFDSLGATVRNKYGRYLGGPILMAYIGWDRMFTNGVVNSPAAGRSYADYDPDKGTTPAPAGVSYYEFVGSDVYNGLNSPGVLQYGTDAATLLDDIKAQAIARGKDWMIGEMGCEDGSTQQDHLNKAAWLDSLRTYLSALGTTGPGVCRHLLTTIKQSAEEYRINSSPEASAAWVRLARDPYFADAPGPTVFFSQANTLVDPPRERPLVRDGVRLGGPPVLDRAVEQIPFQAASLVTSGALDVTGTGTITVAASTVTAFSGTLTVTGTGTITVAASLIIGVSGPLAVAGTGTITVAQPLYTAFSGALTLAGTGTVTVLASSVSGSAISAGKLSLSNQRENITVDTPTFISGRLTVDEYLIWRQRFR